MELYLSAELTKTPSDSHWVVPAEKNY